MSCPCPGEKSYEIAPFTFCPLRQEDIFLIKEWRNAQMDILRQEHPLTDEQQREYFEKVIEPSFKEAQPKQILWSILKEGECVGYGGLTHINWEVKKSEISFLLNPKYVVDKEFYQIAFSLFLDWAKQVAFQELNMHRLYTETYDVRPWHVSLLERGGFLLEGRLKNHVKIKGKWVDVLFHGAVK